MFSEETGCSMLIFHGSHVEVKDPKILVSGRIGDFGYGFYTTSSLKQAQSWAQIRAVQENLPKGVVTIYETTDSLFENRSLQILRFEKADEKWLDFVLGNRRNPGFEHPYDIVIGPAADDRVYSWLNSLESGFADRETVIRQLKMKLLADQVLFHTAKALLFLNYKNMEVIPCFPK